MGVGGSAQFLTQEGTNIMQDDWQILLWFPSLPVPSRVMSCPNVRASSENNVNMVLINGNETIPKLFTKQTRI